MARLQRNVQTKLHGKPCSAETFRFVGQEPDDLTKTGLRTRQISISLNPWKCY